MFRIFISWILKRTILSKRLEILERKKKLYKEVNNSQEIYDYQLMEFNKTWKYCIETIPFYTKWKEDHNLPSEILSISDLKSFPFLTKTDIYENQEFILKSLKDYYLTSTGGTSGITTHFPTSKANADEAYANAYLGRSWWAIEPLDNILMFWGHSHLFGKGYKRYIRQVKRKVSDILINTRKISCYSLDIRNVKEFYEKILEIEPKIIISYASNIFKICKYMETNNLYYKGKDFKGVILTSETVTQTDVDLINKYLNAPVIHEFGMAETGAISYSFKETNNIKTFWDSFILTHDEDNQLIITTIGDNIFPLINYTSEDTVTIRDIYKESILSLLTIEGKVRNILDVDLVDGSKQKISTIFFDHVLKYYSNIYSIHYQQKENGITIFVTSDIQLDIQDLKKYIQSEVEKEFNNINFDAIEVFQMETTEKTVAGKNKTFLS